MKEEQYLTVYFNEPYVLDKEWRAFVTDYKPNWSREIVYKARIRITDIVSHVELLEDVEIDKE